MIEDQTLLSVDCPWPGPAPYSEEQAERFLGRTQEVGELLSLIEYQQLNVLIALSGVGKSSLLQAGLVPALRKLREEKGAFGPVLVVRHWALLGEVHPATLLLQAIRAATQELLARTSADDESILRQDARKLVRVPVSGPEASPAGPEGALSDLLAYVHKLCNVAGSMVLIIDQAEELLGSGLPGPDQEVEREVLRVIAKLFEQEKRLRVLLSLREEYLGRISLLARDVEGLDKRIFRLNPMPQTTVKDVLRGAAGVTQNSVTFGSDGAIETLLRWLGEIGESPSEGQRGAPVDLLRLQALLVGIFQHARQTSEQESIVIDDDLLKRYKKHIEAALGRGEIPTRELARQALENHIERILQSAPEAPPPPQVGRGLMKRTLVRMAPWLSSPGGFKRHVPIDELIFHAIRDDLDVLSVTSKPESIRAAILAFQRNQASNLDVEFEGEEEGRNLSGLALMGERAWSRGETGTAMVRAAIEVLALLRDRYVVKASQGWTTGTTVTCELVHDGFGPALFEWAERERLQLSDTLAAVVSRRGETFRWPRITERTLARVSWLGCSINDKHFLNVTFEGCVLTGSIFTNCTFECCSFRNCDLRGTVFVAGSWKSVRWESCQANSVLMRLVRWNNVAIISSILENITLIDGEVDGLVLFNDCAIPFSQITKFSGFEGQQCSLEFRDCDLQNAFLQERRAILTGDNSNENGLLRRRSGSTAPERGQFSAGVV